MNQFKKNANSKRPWLPPPRYLFRRYNIIEMLQELSDINSFIDYGCGAGDLSCTLVKRLGMKGTGVDFSQKAIKTANTLKAYYGLGKYPVFRSVAGVELKNNKADLVICCEVLEHVKDDEALLDQLIKLSKKYVLISVPSKQRLFGKSDTMAGHYRRYEKIQLTELLQSKNLSIVTFISYGFPFTNLIRRLREVLANPRKTKSGTTMIARSKKSGIDLLGLNKFMFGGLENILTPFFFISKFFNSLDLAEGYLVICRKND